MGDAGAHHASAEYAQTLEFAARRVLGSARELVELTLVHEHRPHQVARDGPGQEPCEMLRLDFQGQIERYRGALVQGAEDLAGSGIVAADRLGHERGAHRERLGDARMGQPTAAGQPEALVVPRCRCLRASQEPCACAFDQCVPRRHRMHESELQSLGRTCVSAVGDELRRGRNADQSGDALRAASARQQADLDLRHADDGLRVVGQHPVVARERQLQPTAEREPIDRGGHRLADGLQAPEYL